MHTLNSQHHLNLRLRHLRLLFLLPQIQPALPASNSYKGRAKTPAKTPYSIKPACVFAASFNPRPPLIMPSSTPILPSQT